MQEKTVTEAINYRRSVRIYDSNKPIDSDVVKRCIELASLSPNSSNMQLWEFYHITSKEMVEKIAPLCFNQNAAKTAQQLVIFVTRKDLWKERAKANLAYLDNVFPPKPVNEQSGREKFARNYYKKTMPFAYSNFLGILGFVKKIISSLSGIFKPTYRQISNNDMRVVAHKSTGLATQTFMLSMASVGYDTCPMEGFDSLRVKKLLNLPCKAEINMIVSCGIRAENGVYGERFRVPFNSVYTKI